MPEALSSLRLPGWLKQSRGTLFFEVARLAQAKRPSYLLLENVPGLLSHDKGRTFSVILTTLLQLGYSVEWMVLIRFFIPNGFAIWNAPGILPGGAADAARKDVQFQSLQTIRFAATALLWQLLLNTFNSNLEIGIHSADFGVP